MFFPDTLKATLTLIAIIFTATPSLAYDTPKEWGYEVMKTGTMADNPQNGVARVRIFVGGKVAFPICQRTVSWQEMSYWLEGSVDKCLKITSELTWPAIEPWPSAKAKYYFQHLPVGSELIMPYPTPDQFRAITSRDKLDAVSDTLKNVDASVQTIARVVREEAPALQKQLLKTQAERRQTEAALAATQKDLEVVRSQNEILTATIKKSDELGTEIAKAIKEAKDEWPWYIVGAITILLAIILVAIWWMLRRFVGKLSKRSGKEGTSPRNETPSGEHLSAVP